MEVALKRVGNVVQIPEKHNISLFFIFSARAEGHVCWSIRDPDLNLSSYVSTLDTFV